MNVKEFQNLKQRYFRISELRNCEIERWGGRIDRKEGIK